MFDRMNRGLQRAMLIALVLLVSSCSEDGSSDSDAGQDIDQTEDSLDVADMADAQSDDAEPCEESRISTIRPLFNAADGEELCSEGSTLQVVMSYENEERVPTSVTCSCRDGELLQGVSECEFPIIIFFSTSDEPLTFTGYTAAGTAPESYVVSPEDQACNGVLELEFTVPR